MITPADSASAPGPYAGVPVSGLDIQAPQDDLTATFNAANDAAGAGVLYPVSDRQQETRQMLESPQGYGTFAILGGSSGGGGEDWPADVRP